MWISSAQFGHFQIESRTGDRMDATPVLAHQNVQDVFEDKEGNIWVDLTPAWIGCRVSRFELYSRDGLFSGKRTSNGQSFADRNTGWGRIWQTRRANRAGVKGKHYSWPLLCHPADRANESAFFFSKLILAF